MRESQLDHWTKELVRSSLTTLTSSLAGFHGESRLLGDLTERTRQLLGRELGGSATGKPSAALLGEELAMAVYLTVAADGPDVELTPDLLPALSLGLTRTLRSLHSTDPQETAQGGVE